MAIEDVRQLVTSLQEIEKEIPVFEETLLHLQSSSFACWSQLPQKTLHNLTEGLEQSLAALRKEHEEIREQLEEIWGLCDHALGKDVERDVRQLLENP